jgi:hypothetical protein
MSNAKYVQSRQTFGILLTMVQLSGTVLMFTFTLLVLSALPYFRNKIYELFKFGHIVLALAFFCFLFWHIAGEYITVRVTNHNTPNLDVY